MLYGGPAVGRVGAYGHQAFQVLVHRLWAIFCPKYELSQKNGHSFALNMPQAKMYFALKSTPSPSQKLSRPPF